MKTKIGILLLAVATVTLIGYLIVNNYKLRQIVQNYEHLVALNEAYTDSLRTSFNKKTGEWESSRKAYIAEKAVLDKFLGEKEQELAKLRKKGAATGAIIDTETKIDTVVVTKTLPDSITRVATIDALPHYEASVVSTPDSTRLKLMAYVRLKYGLNTKTGVLKVTTDNPYVTINRLDGYYVLPPEKKSKFWRGFMVGAGVVVGGVILMK